MGCTLRASFKAHIVELHKLDRFVNDAIFTTSSRKTGECRCSCRYGAASSILHTQIRVVAKALHIFHVLFAHQTVPPSQSIQAHQSRALPARLVSHAHTARSRGENQIARLTRARPNAPIVGARNMKLARHQLLVDTHRSAGVAGRVAAAITSVRCAVFFADVGKLARPTSNVILKGGYSERMDVFCLRTHLTSNVSTFRSRCQDVTHLSKSRCGARMCVWLTVLVAAIVQARVQSDTSL